MTYLLLVQSTPDPVALAGWLGCLAFVIMLVNQGGKALDRFRGQPPAEQLASAARSADQRITQCEKDLQVGSERRREIYARIEASTKQAQTQAEAVRDELKADIAAVYTEINRLRETVAGLCKIHDLLNQQLARVEAKLDRAIEHTKHR